MADLEVHRFLAHFLGPKGENEDLLEELLVQILRDYAHWRRNYFPQDPPILTLPLQRQLEESTEHIRHRVNIMLAELRRSFPFYSPRYIAHQQSEVSLASILGVLAGTLYNPNNVTPESGSVTVEWEIEACNKLLRMVGFTPPPDPPRQKSEVEPYFKSLEREFGWCHLCSGGTVANMEALWVARAVRYFPLAVRDAASSLGISLEVKKPNGEAADLKSLSPLEVLHIKPNESVYLLGRLVSAVKKERDLSVEDAGLLAMEHVSESPYSLAKGVGRAFSDFPPVVLASGAAHYSIAKSLDILGLGRDSFEIVEMDAHFRLDIRDLSAKLKKIAKQGRVPLAVTAIVGTTEEGAVDPVHKVLELRGKLEKEQCQSFWVHVDAAWGGFLRSLYVFHGEIDKGENSTSKELFLKRIEKISAKLAIESGDDISRWVGRVLPDFGPDIGSESDNHKDDGLAAKRERLCQFAVQGQYHQFLNMLSTLAPDIEKRFGTNLGTVDFKVSREDRVDCVGDFVSERIEISLGGYKKEVSLKFAQYDVGLAICAIERVDSVTIDPHKMGYAAYPCGAIAFKNDRVRHFIAQDAPYITSHRSSSLVHRPPRFAADLPTDLAAAKISTMAFAPFTLEGSRPGAAACSLWLASETLPFDKEHHGAIIRSSLLAARELHEWLKSWDRITSEMKIDVEYEFLPFVEMAPDTNIVIFGVKRKSSRSIEAFNALGQRVYNHFSIQSELGQRSYSYSQPFFLSKTWFKSPEYSFSSVRSFLDRHDFRDPQSTYSREGLLVLRATVMNPYLHPLRSREKQNIIRDFVKEIAAVAAQEVKTV